MQKKQNNIQRPRQNRRLGRFTILELMGFLAIAGIIATWLLHHFA